jgi:hypothetical protein
VVINDAIDFNWKIYFSTGEQMFFFKGLALAPEFGS